MYERICLGLVLAMVSLPASAAIIASEDFDGGATNLIGSTQSPGDFTGAGDMFGVRSRSTLVGGIGLPFAISDDSVVAAAGNVVFPTDSQGIVGQNKSDAFFGVVDLTNPQNTGGTGFASWTFDISGAGDLVISVDVGAMGDFEAGSDAFTFSVSIDGGPLATVFDFQANEAGTKTYRAMDSGGVFTYDDPLVEAGTGQALDKSNPATGALDTFSAGLTGTGSSLTLRLDASSDGGSEAFAFDNILITGTVTGVPAPSTLALLAAGLLGFGAARRTRH